MTDGTRQTPAPRPAPGQKPVLSRQGLARAARRSLERNRPGQGTQPRRRLPRWRVALWIAEGVALLAVLEAFVLRPLLARRRALLPPPAPVAHSPRQPLVPLGPRARLPAGLREVTPAFPADLQGLAEGSATMRAAQESFSAESGLPVEVENSIGMRFRLVPPGTAILGSPVEEPGRGEAETQHVVVVPTAFYLGACEVTQAEWSRCTPANLSRYPGARRPVEEVSWYDCQRFLAALCQTEGLAEGTYRLPTEGEWEYACRAGTTTAFCSGDAPLGLDAVATHADNGSGGTADVDTKRPNALGLFEMHGNVWEWCLDRFGPYPGADQPPEPEHENWRCLRGGNWYVPRLDCRSAERGRLPPPSTGSMLGFRVLREIGAETHTAPEPPTP